MATITVCRCPRPHQIIRLPRWVRRADCHVWETNKKANGRVLDGRVWDEFPEVAPQPEKREAR